MIDLVKNPLNPLQSWILLDNDIPKGEIWILDKDNLDSFMNKDNFMNSKTFQGPLAELNYMPLKISKKGGGTKSRSFGQVVGEFKRKGDSEKVARAKAGKIQALQEGTYKKKRKR